LIYRPGLLAANLMTVNTYSVFNFQNAGVQQANLDAAGTAISPIPPPGFENFRRKLFFVISSKDHTSLLTFSYATAGWLF